VKVPSVGQIAQDFHKFAFAPAHGLELECECVDSQRAANFRPETRTRQSAAGALSWTGCPSERSMSRSNSSIGPSGTDGKELKITKAKTVM